MNGTRANRPASSSTPGDSGTSPPGPSITGAKGNWKVVKFVASQAAMRDGKLALRRQSNELSKSDPAHSGVAPKKACHAGVRKVASAMGMDACALDSMIYTRMDVEGM